MVVIRNIYYRYSVCHYAESGQVKVSAVKKAFENSLEVTR